MNSLISIIVPVYNVEKYINRCVDSILNQTYKNLEIILVDDGSTDYSGKICDEYEKKDRRIKVIHTENKGVGIARNQGLETCHGEYIMFVDPDDYLSKDAVQVLYDRVMIDSSDMAIGKHIDVYDDGSKNGNFCDFYDNVILSRNEFFLNIHNYSVSVWSKLYRKNILKDLKFPTLKCGEDLCFFIQLIDYCNKISIVDKTIYYYFQNQKSVTHCKSELVKYDELEALLSSARYLLNYGFIESAAKYFEKGICKALLFENKHIAISVFRNNFDCILMKKLLKKQDIKTRFKWLSLYSPFIYRIAKHMKRWNFL